MRKLKAIYIALLIIVGILLGYTSLTITNQLAQSKESTVLVQKSELIDLGSRAIIQFRIINPARHDRDYSYKIYIALSFLIFIPSKDKAASFLSPGIPETPLPLL